MMMTLGWFVFGLRTFAPQSQQDERSWRHPGNARIGTAPAYQFTGRDDETSTLSGSLYPEITGGPVSLDLLHSMADTGEAFPLLQGDGVMRGYFVIEGTSVKHLRHVYANEGNAKRAARAEWERLQRGVAEFTLNLAIGRPELYPEQPTTVSGFKPDIDSAPWLLTQVVHDLSNSGYTNRLQLEVKLEELPE